jgi:hypothetical protein
LLEAERLHLQREGLIGLLEGQHLFRCCAAQRLFQAIRGLRAQTERIARSLDGQAAERPAERGPDPGRYGLDDAQKSPCHSSRSTSSGSIAR